ncbi:GNAT family N-acetyltransferase [Aquimarina litoralis]|uniref:GNAT family N-acetyltransferase n=1 Tax=Aquimarina litoralis TaxID=584605 RepID=UPI001C58AD81|nr:GNAT family N-acetyltransferase [Aquimarina litoralis]MBW1294002.1 GNAT family N-acetyltransferase [Aquimarina litoralis]
MKSEILFRKAQKQDALQLSILYKQVYMKTYAVEGITHEFANFASHKFSIEAIKNKIEKENSIIIATYKDNPVGVAEIVYNSICPIRNIVSPELGKLYVLDWFFGKGIGYGLLNHVEIELKNKSHEEYWLWVYIKNNRAISFYEKQHFTCIGNAFFDMEMNSYENKVMRKALV